MSAISTCNKCGIVVRDDGTIVGGARPCHERVPPVEHNLVLIQGTYNISYFQYIFNLVKKKKSLQDPRLLFGLFWPFSTDSTF